MQWDEQQEKIRERKAHAEEMKSCLKSGVSVSADEKSSVDESQSALLPKTWSASVEISTATNGERNWNHRHQFIWSNDLVAGRWRKNKNSICSKTPVGLRSYFDRGRSPGIHRTDAGEGFRYQRKMLKPVWKLGGKPEPPVITSLSRPCLSPVRDPAFALPREEGWLTRHQLSFENEGLSPLSRSYFDRPREPEALLEVTEETVKASPLVPTWRLGPEPNEPSKDSLQSTVSLAQEHREGSWDPRHHIVWCNDFLLRAHKREEKKLNPNYRSYFDRHLQPKPDKGSKKREKLKESERLRPDTWSLQDPRQGPGTLSRASVSNPELLRRQEKWHGRHGTEF